MVYCKCLIVVLQTDQSNAEKVDGKADAVNDDHGGATGDICIKVQNLHKAQNDAASNPKSCEHRQEQCPPCRQQICHMDICIVAECSTCVWFKSFVKQKQWVQVCGGQGSANQIRGRHPPQ